ncbi:MAG TPA: hypothetical protein PKC24_15295, partial [Cyclobacteriaceae bacterium]|nr:hypothetical protein [Cyclobacteriaceae bacterium]
MNWQIIKKWTAKISLYLITLIIGLFFLVFVLVQLPAVQLRISNAILSSIEKQTGYTGKFDRFYLLWYDRLQFNNFTLTDPENNDMLQVGSFYMNFNLSRLILKRDIFLEAAIIQSGTLYLTPIQQNDSSSTLNLVHFVDKIKALSDKEKAQRGSKINMGEMILEDMHFVLNDTRKEPKAEGIEFAHLAVDINGIELQGIELFNDTIQFQINKLRAV